MGSRDDHLGTPVRERLSALWKAYRKARTLKAASSQAAEPGSASRVTQSTAEAVIARWPPGPAKTAEKLIEHYGPPNEATPTKLFWYRTGPWSRIELTADEVRHDFPASHTDYLTQYVDYPIKADKAADLLAFDGSVILDRTAGQLGARCSNEPYNTLTINLAVEIMDGRRTVEDARRFYADTMSSFLLGRPAPYAERLLLEPPAGATGDPDVPIIARHAAAQAVEKVKDFLTEDPPPS